MSTPPVRMDPFEKDKASYYEILDIAPDASASDIRQAYFRAKAAYGKDSTAIYSLFDVQETKSLLERIEEAYLVLSNIDRRKEYDKTHGFFKGGEELQTARRPIAKNVFSFSPKAETARSHSDPAAQAASLVFGSEAVGDASTPFGSEKPSPPATNTSVTPATHHERMDISIFSTPRTLASAESAGPPAQEYVTPSSEPRMGGAVRRMDLAKPYSTDPTMEQAISDETQYRGDFLRRVREYKSITMDELCEFTKISKTYLNCIEAEEFDSLPAPAYVRGFVSQVAKAMKLPSDKVAAGYMKHYYSVVGGK